MKIYSLYFHVSETLIMYVGFWETDYDYFRGDIVFVEDLQEYYICILEHKSNNITYPNKDDIYWIYVSSTFLRQFLLVNLFSDIQTPEDPKDTENLNDPKDTNLNDPKDTAIKPKKTFTGRTKQKSLKIKTSGLKKEKKSDTGSESLPDTLPDTLLYKFPDVDSQSDQVKRKGSKKTEHEAGVAHSDDENYIEHVKRQDLKRRIRLMEDDLETHKKKRMKGEDEISCLRDRLLMLNVDMDTKSVIVEKYDNTRNLSGSDYAKGMNWLRTVSKIPYGRYKPMGVTRTDSVEMIQSFFTNVKASLDKNIHGLEDVKQEILEFVAKRITNPNSKGHVLALYGPPGIGKCFQKDTPILMSDGSIRMVQDVKVGDLLMGDDSTPRRVLSLGGGRDTMYKITDTRGDSYTVNSEHILCLQHCRHKRVQHSVKHKRYRVIWFNHKRIRMEHEDFYYTNVKDNIHKTSSDKVLTKTATLVKVQKFVRTLGNRGVCEIPVKDYIKLPQSLQRDLRGYSVSVEFPENTTDIDPYTFGLRLFGSRADCIPQNYKCNSRTKRLQLLAGLLDACASIDICKGEYTMYNISQNITGDIVYLCKSLGIDYTVSKTTSYTNQNTITSTITVTGVGSCAIPTRVLKKFNNVVNTTKSHTCTYTRLSCITVTRLPEDDYYGFMIDGNERFVLGNFIVTHNTKIIRSLAEALDLPFYQINFGGLNDSAVLLGHSETYVGSKPGKIAEIMSNSEYMNPIIYMDEIDKISETKATEIFGVLTHLLDEEQNTTFQDNYLSNITLDLSKVFFVLAFNDITRVDEIVSDRLKIIYIDPPKLDDKIIICQDKMIPEIIRGVGIKDDYTVTVDKEIIEYIISAKTPSEKGVRQLRKNIEKIMNRLNYDILVNRLDKLSIETLQDQKMIIVTRSYVEEVLKLPSDDKTYLSMYI